MKARPIRIESEANGTVVIVPLGRSGKASATIDLADYEELLSLGVSPNWRVSNFSVASGQYLVSRILMDAKAGQRVRYLDKNSFNLRRSNLYLENKGWSVSDGRPVVHDGL